MIRHRAQEEDPVSQVDRQSRTTALNKVAITKATTLNKKTRSNIKTKKMDTSLVFSDEDDSLERDVALNSPQKGKDFQQSSKVREYELYYTVLTQLILCSDTNQGQAGEQTEQEGRTHSVSQSR
jgi:hypothetical protein